MTDSTLTHCPCLTSIRVAAWSMYDVRAGLQHHPEFARGSLGTFALGDLGLVMLVEDPDTFTHDPFRVGIRDFTAGKAVNS